MRNIVLSLSLICLFLADESPAQTTFERTYSVPGVATFGYSACQTSDGGYIIAGETYSSGSDEACVIKTNSLGETEWTRTYGEQGQETSHSILQTLDGGYLLLGSKYSSGQRGIASLVRLSSSGDTVWSRAYVGTNGVEGSCVKQTSDGGYVIAGTSSDIGDSADVCLFKTDSLGHVAWARSYGGGKPDRAHSVRQTSDGGYIIAGETWSYGGDECHIYLVKTDSVGDTIWTRTLGPPRWTWGGSTDLTSDGGFIVGGVFSAGPADTNSVYLVKVNFAGDTVWTRTYRLAGFAVAPGACSLQRTSDGGFIMMVGAFVPLEGGRATPEFIFLLRMNSSGDTLWTRMYGNGSTWGSSVELTSDGGYVVGGSTNVKTDDTCEVFPHKTRWEILLIKTRADGLQTVEIGCNMIATGLSLSQNYPNPFNPTTNIEYAVGETRDKGLGVSEVWLAVYDILGREVALLVNGKKAPGTYEVRFDASGLSSGVYFYKLQAGSFVQARKMIVIK